MLVPPKTSKDGTTYAGVQAERGLVREVEWLITRQHPGFDPIVIARAQGCDLANVVISAFASVDEA
ncbi:hypothetical protein CcI49_03045 [Frankia sp. CcI49]|uniref:hypothetical protein n=1 Tax=Frankia sp. CcI49 TaxID=1745382 RepID=UPI0009783084|nr:hypothetical protein [Frankia sp. CcI49]ONH62370.1 hypothetical protein CcI49_03045 [Frankia sp. CcI49]